MTGLAEPLPQFDGRRHATPLRGYALYLLAALLFGLNGTVSKSILLTDLTPTQVTQLRITAAFLILLVWVGITRPAMVRIRRDEVWLLLAYSILGVVGTQLFYFIAIERMPVGLALLIEFTAPIWVALWFRFGLKQSTRRTVWAALALAMLGLSLVAQVWQGFSLDGIGTIASLGAAFSLALYYVLSDSAMRRPEPRDPVSFTMWGFGLGAIGFAIVMPWWEFPFAQLAGSTDFDGLTVPIWLLAAYMVLFGTIAAFSLTVASMQILRASQASVVGLTEPLFAIIIAWIVLGEALSPGQLAGGALILAGVLLAERSR